MLEQEANMVQLFWASEAACLYGICHKLRLTALLLIVTNN